MTKKEFRYPQGHNWEGLTPEEVNKGYEKAKETLSDKVGYTGVLDYDDIIHKKDVKEKIQNAQKRLRDELKVHENANSLIRKRVDKIFLEEFGKEMLK